MKDFVIQQLNEIELMKDFNLVISAEQYLMFKRQDGDRLLECSAGDLVSNKVNSIGCLVSFLSLEKYFASKIIDSSELGPTITRANHTYLTGHQFGSGIYNQLPVYFESEEEVSVVIELLKKFIIQDAFPFFEYWNDLRVLLPYLELDHNDVMGSYRVIGNWQFKKAAIWYLTSHPKYQEFVDFHVERYESIINRNDNNMKATIKGKEDFMNLDYRLKASDPLYEWDSDYLIRKEFTG